MALLRTRRAGGGVHRLPGDRDPGGHLPRRLGGAGRDATRRGRRGHGREARAVFEKIDAAVEEFTARIVGIATATSEVTAVAEQSAASTEETSAAAQEIAASARELAHTARDLQGLVGRF